MGTKRIEKGVWTSVCVCVLLNSLSTKAVSAEREREGVDESL